MKSHVNNNLINLNQSINYGKVFVQRFEISNWICKFMEKGFIMAMKCTIECRPMCLKDLSLKHAYEGITMIEYRIEYEKEHGERLQMFKLYRKSNRLFQVI